MCDQMCKYLRRVWKDVGSGRCSMVYASMLTTSCMNTVDRWLPSLLKDCAIESIPKFLERIVIKSTRQPSISIGKPKNGKVGPDEFPFQHGYGFLLPWAALVGVAGTPASLETPLASVNPRSILPPVSYTHLTLPTKRIV